MPFRDEVRRFRSITEGASYIGKGASWLSERINGHRPWPTSGELAGLYGRRLKPGEHQVLEVDG